MLGHSTRRVGAFLLGLGSFCILARAEIPREPLAEPGPAIFVDDFARKELGVQWKVSTPAFSIADGVLKADQTQPHAAVARVPTHGRDLIIQFRVRFGGATSINAVCNDLDYKEGHGGHICRAALSLKQIQLADDKERLRKEIEEMRKDPAQKAEVARRIAGRSVNVPFKFDPANWYAIQIEVVGEEMRVCVDGKPVGYLKSSGLAHPNKREFYFAVNGKDAAFDDLKICETKPK